MYSNRNEELVDKNSDAFFDRDPRVFEVILNYYRTGKIIKPSWIPIELLTEELMYFFLHTHTLQMHVLSP